MGLHADTGTYMHPHTHFFPPKLAHATYVLHRYVKARLSFHPASPTLSGSMLQGDEALRVKSLSLLQRSQSHRFIQKTSSAHCPSSSRGHGAPSGQALQGAQSEGQQQRQLTRGKKEAQATAESFISRRQRSPLRSNQAENKAPEAGRLSS